MSDKWPKDFEKASSDDAIDVAECLGRDVGLLDSWRSRLREVNVSAVWSHPTAGLPWRTKLNICYEVDTADNNLCNASARRLSEMMMAFASTLLPLVYAAHQNDNDLDPRGRFDDDGRARIRNRVRGYGLACPICECYGGVHDYDCPAGD